MSGDAHDMDGAGLDLRHEQDMKAPEQHGVYVHEVACQDAGRLGGAALRAWSDPGWIKVAMEFRLEPAPAGTLLITKARILATDPSSRRFFAAYGFLIRASSATIRREVRSWCQPWSNVIRRSKRSGECRLVCPDRHFLTPGFGPTPGIR